jgi:hypothetical protein
VALLAGAGIIADSTVLLAGAAEATFNEEADGAGLNADFIV